MVLSPALHGADADTEKRSYRPFIHQGFRFHTVHYALRREPNQLLRQNYFWRWRLRPDRVSYRVPEPPALVRPRPCANTRGASPDHSTRTPLALSAFIVSRSRPSFSTSAGSKRRPFAVAMEGSLPRRIQMLTISPETRSRRAASERPIRLAISIISSSQGVCVEGPRPLQYRKHK